jgi:hypothetical protein
MAVTIEMCRAINMTAPKGPIPDGLKVVALSGPTGGTTKTIPVLAIGGFTFWPMSYSDNRMSFGMVMYDPAWKVVSTTEVKQARYIQKITLEGSGENGTVTFWGQDDHNVKMQTSAFEALMLVNAIS